ncbi:MAG TPA: bifunctional phosphopantothenoylcysteine decarboxylase/phosphopantothenate--cysteine ligase CoaBC [Candidatus Polarisedimenticolaceae bacterium]
MLVALGVSGGIAAYKAAEVLRGLTRAGADVRVLMTENATRFVTPLTLRTLSGHPVQTGVWDMTEEETVRHIDLTRQIDALVVAPATANVLAKFAHGIADDLLSTFYVSVVKPIVLAPAMNTRMWLNPATQENVRLLKARGARIVDPEAGWLAERESGWGRLAAPEAIVEAALAAARLSSVLSGRKIVVSAGPTREAIDPVRYLSNRSSGKMGYAIACAAARRGASVTLVSGPVDLAPPYGVEVVRVTTAAQMRSAVLEARRGAAAVYMAAAVADFVPRAEASKIKKSGDTPLVLTLEQGPDILAELGRTKGNEILVGFAAETDDLLANAARKLDAKGADFIVANDVAGTGIGLDADRNAVTVLGRDGSRRDVPEASKAEIAEAILDLTLAGGAA